jgi:hypothetical protein
MARIAFISGPLDPSDDYLEKYYVPRLQEAIQNGDSFVVGPMPGIDELALDYLLSHGAEPLRITVYMTEFEYSTTQWRQSFEERGIPMSPGGRTTRDRDRRMTEASDYDILRYRTEKECKELYGSMWSPRVSNTEMNERRRQGIVHEMYISHCETSN